MTQELINWLKDKMAIERPLSDKLKPDGDYHLGKWAAYDDVLQKLLRLQSTSPAPSELRWVKASERLPELPNPLPPNTEDERGVLFVNRTHSCAQIWYPSYGYDAVKTLHTTEDGHWSLDQWEWLEEGKDLVPSAGNTDVEPVASHSSTEGNSIGQVKAIELCYSKKEVQSALQQELIEAYGGMSRDKEGNELNTPYMVMGIFHEAWKRLIQKTSKASYDKEAQ